MSGHNSWRINQDMPGWMRNVEKRILSQERRLAPTDPSDTMGPGLGAFAVQVWDWNDEVTTFNGVYFSDPDDGQQNAPDSTSYWMGETFGTEEGFGWQRLTRYKLNSSVPPGTGSWIQYRRRFFPLDDTGALYFSAWETF